MLEKILEYQTAETELIRLESELTNSKDRIKASEISQNLKNQHAKIISLDAMAGEMGESYKIANGKFNEYLEKLKEVERKVENVKDAEVEAFEETLKEFSALTNSLEREIQQIYANMLQINRDYEDTIRKSKTDREHFDYYRAAYAKLKAEQDPKIEEAKAKLAKLEKQVDENLLSVYKKKRDGKVFPVYVPVSNNLCSGCRMEIPFSKLSKMKSNDLNIIECENCGRLIYKDV